MTARGYFAERARLSGEGRACPRDMSCQRAINHKGKCDASDPPMSARKPSAAQLRVLRNRKAGRAVDYVPRGKPPMRNLNKTIAVCKARGWFQVDRWDGWEHELTPAGREAARRARD